MGIAVAVDESEKFLGSECGRYEVISMRLTPLALR